jgi:uncharacterized protein
MSGEQNLEVLLRTMQPNLNEGQYIFTTVQELPQDLGHVSFFFKEKEGITVVCLKIDADLYGYKYAGVMSWITLAVHSSLEAVGLTAAFSQALTQAEISCNVVAGFYHDHIFVPEERALAAMAALSTLSQG